MEILIKMEGDMFDAETDEEETETRKLGRTDIEELFRVALYKWDKRKAAIGDTVPIKWFFDLLGVTHPSKANSFEQSERVRREFMVLFHGQSGFRAYLLEHRKRWLKSNNAQGYEVLDPEVQTKYAQKQRRNDINKAMRDELFLLTNVDLGLVSANGKKENMDALAHHEALAHMLRRRKPGFE